MILYAVNHRAHYEIMSLFLVFIKNQKINIVFNENPKVDEKNYIYSEIIKKQNEYIFYVKIKMDDIILSNEEIVRLGIEGIIKEAKNIFSRLIYKILSKHTGIMLDWGIYTGVRPVKLITSRLVANTKKDDIYNYLKSNLLIAGEKIDLSFKIALTQQKIFNKMGKNKFSLYINIPFCPSRCYYCSFISLEIGKDNSIVKDYILSLCREIEYTSFVAKEANLELETIYIGGGTPTSIDDKFLEILLKTIEKNFDICNKEYTIEAGRPDTITIEKLKIMKAFGVTRIGINPQTTNEKTLSLIGRNHSIADFYNVFSNARRLEYNNINIDLIAGLEGENLIDFKNSVNSILELSPENITIHSLAVKKSSALKQKLLENGSEKFNYADGTVKAMLDYSYKEIDKAGYQPYYLYKQKNSKDNTENTGFTKEGFACKYNIYMMEEVQNVISCGAGGTTKIINGDKRIERIFNYKMPDIYLKNFQQIIKRKDKILEILKGKI